MSGRLREYSSDGITITYAVKRCIHAAECVHGVPLGFLIPSAGPGSTPGRAIPARSRRRSSSVPPEPCISSVTMEVRAKPLQIAIPSQLRRMAPSIEGDLTLSLPDGSALRETRAALCRCGSSQNKPFCDNTHLETKFSDPGGLDVQVGGSGKPQDEKGELKVRSAPNGPLLLQGPLTIESADGVDRKDTTRCALCRCGESQNKPFCDGTHGKVNFQAP